jgi:hypothetical protein
VTQVGVALNGSLTRSHTGLMTGQEAITATVGSALFGVVMGFLLGYCVAAERFRRAIQQIDRMYRGTEEAANAPLPRNDTQSEARH